MQSRYISSFLHLYPRFFTWLALLLTHCDYANTFRTRFLCGRVKLPHPNHRIDRSVTIEQITSPSNPRIKAAQSLREARHRREHDLIIIDGESIARHAVAGGVQCTEIFLQQSEDESHRLVINAWQQLCPDIRINVVSRPAMQKLQYGGMDLELIAIAKTPNLALETLDERLLQRAPTERQVYLVLDQMEKPGNLGAVLRSADAAGVTAVLLSDPVCDAWNPNAIRSSLGALFRVPIAAGSASQVRRWLIEHEVSMFAARVDGTKEYTQVEYPSRCAIVVGSESDGLDQGWIHPEIESVTIPMNGAVDSLNVSVSTAVVLFEVVRQHASASRRVNRID